MRTLLGAITLTILLTTGGALARQALHINDGPLIGWRCPHCGAGNAADPGQTFRAVCRKCSDGYDWEDVQAVTGGSARPPGAADRPR